MKIPVEMDVARMLSFGVRTSALRAREKQCTDEPVRDAALKYIAQGGVDRKKPTGP